MSDNNSIDNKTYCALCGEWVKNRAHQDHLKSRKHQVNLNTKTRIDKKAFEAAENGVIVTGVPPELEISAIVTYFYQFGDLLAITKLGSGEIAVQFENGCSAEGACKSQEHSIEGANVSVVPRPVKNYDGGFNGEEAALSRLKQKLEMHFGNTPKGSLNDQLSAMVAKFQASQQKISAKHQVTSNLSEWLRLKFPHHVLHIFGSSANGLDFDDCSDMDLCLHSSPETSNEIYSQETSMETIKLAASVLSAHPDVVLFNIAPARVPVARLLHTPCGIAIDLIVDNIKGVKSSKFVTDLQTFDPRIRPFLFSLKLWATVHSVTGNNLGFKTYAVMLLGIFYLQRVSPCLIPPIASLQLQVPADQRELHQGWNFSYVTPDKPPAGENETAQDIDVFILLKGFFNFYQSFDHKGIVICPLLGRELPQDKFSSTPPSLDEIAFEPYFKYLRDGGEPLKFGQRLTIQDPFELNLNVAAGVVKYEPFRKLCEKHFKICCDLEAASGQSDVSCSLFPLFNSHP